MVHPNIYCDTNTCSYILRPYGCIIYCGQESCSIWHTYTMYNVLLLLYMSVGNKDIIIIIIRTCTAYNYMVAEKGHAHALSTTH